MKQIISESPFSKKWLAAGLAAAAFLLCLAWITAARHATPSNPTVLSGETINPLGIPEQPAMPTPPRLEGSLTLSPIKAQSFLAYDVNSGAVLAQREPAQPLAVASVTKLMAGLVIYKSLPSFKQEVTITPKDLFTVEPALGLKVTDKITVGDLFYAMLVGSANDAALALANHVEAETGQNFVKLMNGTARELGMSNSHFSNPLGFDSEANYSTAEDLRKLIQETQKYQAFNLVGRNQLYSFTSNSGVEYSIQSTNKLTRLNQELYAIKTGYTDLAQGAMITESRDHGHPFVIIILGSPDREADTLALRSQILENYVWQ